MLSWEASLVCWSLIVVAGCCKAFVLDYIYVQVTVPVPSSRMSCPVSSAPPSLRNDEPLCSLRLSPPARSTSKRSANLNVLRESTMSGCLESEDADEFAYLVESHPLDDTEPRKSASSSSSDSGTRSRPTKPSPLNSNPNPNPYSIPKDSHEEWDWFYDRLKARYEAQQTSSGRSTSNAVSDIVEESLMRHWMASQRKSFMKTLGVLDIADQHNWGTPFLKRDRKERLDHVGFDWGHLQPSTLTNDFVYSEHFQRQVRLKYKHWIWMPQYKRLKQYRREHGHTRVPVASDDHLGAWAADQRRLRDQLPERRRQLLDQIHFDWECTDENQQNAYKTEDIINHTEDTSNKSVPFSKRLVQLKAYRSAHDDCQVPADYEEVPGLGQWVEETKRRRRRLTPRSIQQLEKVGFVFSDDADDTLETDS